MMAVNSEAAIVLQHVAKTFQEGGQPRTVFRSLDMAVPTGALTVLVGRSGSGKTTLLNLISGIDLPDRGEVRVAGQAMTQLSDRQRTLLRRRHIGFVFQFFNLLPTLSVAENLMLPLELGRRMTGTRRKQARGKVVEMLERVGLADRTASFPDHLSGGEQQRVAIVRALVHDPEVILADEPTGNLDAETGQGVLALLCELARSAGKTLLMVTHSAEAAALADRVLAIESGRLVERMPADR